MCEHCKDVVTHTILHIWNLGKIGFFVTFSLKAPFMKQSKNKYTSTFNNECLASDNLHATYFGGVFCAAKSLRVVCTFCQCYIRYTKNWMILYVDFRFSLARSFQLVLDFWLRIHCLGITKDMRNFNGFIYSKIFSKLIYIKWFVRWKINH